MVRYSSWGSDSTYRWLWRAALQDAIFSFKNRINADRSIYTDEHEDINRTSDERYRND